MAPRGVRRSEVAEPQAIYKLGERGRKTGVELIDTGNRDEYGMQPLDDLLSSPEKETGFDQRYEDEDEAPNNDQYESGDDEDEAGSEDMDIETIPGPGPQTVLRENRQYPIPRSRSPVKTTLMSSPRRNPNLEHLSSPTRPPFSNDRDATVTRKIDFGAKPSLRGKATANGVNGGTHEGEGDDDDDDADETEDAPEAKEAGDVGDDMDLLDKSLELVDDLTRHSSEHGSEHESEPVKIKASAKDKSQGAEPEPKKPGKRGRPAKAKPVQEEPAEEEPVEEEPEEIQVPGKGRRGRKPKTAVQPKKSAAPESRKRPAPEEPEEAEEHEESENEASDPEPEPEESPRQVKKPRTEASKPSKPTKSAPAVEPKPRGRPGRKPKAQTASDVGDTSIAAIQHRPPMPKKRGLVSVRHNPDEVKTTRSGRHSFKPLNWWAGDRVVQEEEEFKDVSGRDRFVLSTIKEIIRAPQEEPPAKPRTKARGRPKSKPVREVEVVEPEEWELNPGIVNAEVILWEPEHETNPPGDEEPVEVMEDRVAISGEAIQTRVVQNVSFRMAKTLTTPFMGAGVVDLPAGSEKRPKNSRKMHMVFFVHTGKVLVTVNEASFRLSAGGMWFVPRGNYYSITNDYDTDSRIFFTQGCEISAQPTEPDQSQMSMMA